MIQREITKKIKAVRGKFPVLMLTGPRQSGKTYLLRHVYKNLPYVSLENIDTRTFASNDPRGFLSNYPNGAILDEVQNVPELFSYIQGIVDEQKIHFVLSGSQNFNLIEKVTQSLAGRTAVLSLLPLSIDELKHSKITFDSYEEYIFTGMYPRIYDQEINPLDFYPSYTTTYLEKDVRQIKNIENLATFSQFIKLCAGRIGQLVNYNSLANDLGVAPKTVKSWLNILEASYIIYFLQPFHKNFNKRIVKTPKMYFHDTGLACSLLGLNDPNQITTYYNKGALFENFVINEFTKATFNHGLRTNLYFWQSKTKKEIDLIIEKPDKIIPIEIKSGQTKHERYLTNIKHWKEISQDEKSRGFVVYGGDENFKTSAGDLISWRKTGELAKKLLL